MILQAIQAMKYVRQCLFILSLLALTNRGFAIDHPLASQTWRTENGLPQNSVHSILQTRDGFVWLATEGGLVRFDGVRFVVYDRQNTPQLKSNNIRALAEDRHGALWIASAGGLTRFANATWTAFTVPDGLPSDNVWSVEVDGEGKVWAATTDGLARWANHRFAKVATTGGAIGALALAPRGALLIATQEDLQLFFREGNFQTVVSPIKSNVEAILSEASNRLWLGTAQGLWLTNGPDKKLYTTADGLPSNHITTLFAARDGSIWAGTDAGAARISNGQVERFSAGQAILSFSEDREGDIWVGTEADGVTILRRQKFVTLSDSPSPVRCVFQDHTGVVWMGTAGTGLRRWADGKFSALTTQDGLSSDQVFALAEDAAGDLLVGTPDGLNRIQGGRVSVLTSADGLADDFVRSLFRDTDGSVWIGTRRGLSHWKNGRFKTYTQRDGLGSDLVGAVLRTKTDDLWIGTLHGLSRLQNGRLTNLTTRDGLSSDIVTALHEDAAGSLWIGTEGGGLNLYRNRRLTRFAVSLGLPATIYGITEDSRGNLWMPASTGVYRATITDLKRAADGGAEANVVSYGTGDGLKISECTGGGHPAVWKSNDGALWFATPKGAAVLRPGDAHLNDVPPPVVIESVALDDHSFDPERLKQVSPGHARIAFEYAGLSFVAPQKVIFRYKLEGFDRQWIDAGTRRVAYYTNLSPGRYIFRVLARNNDGIWNESGATFEFQMLPHFYQTFWFASLMLVLLCLLAYATYRWRVREVESRFQVVLEERNRIAREIHDTLSQGFVAVSVQLEVVSQLLTSSTESAKDHLNQARSMVRESLAEARTAIWALRSHSSAHEDLAGRLSKTADQLTQTSSAKVRLKVHGPYRPLERVLEDELVRIGQEALANAVRHANAENIEIELAFEPKRLRMTIADDGRGFTIAPNGHGPAGHFGLQGMRERAGQIHADLTVESSLGAGTRVSVEARLS